MPIFKKELIFQRKKDSAFVHCCLSVAEIFPGRGKSESDDCLHITLTTDANTEEPRSAYCPLNKKELQELNDFLTKYLSQK